MDVATNGKVQERELCKRVNAAAAASQWAVVQELLLNTYSAELGLSISDIAGIRSEKELFLRMGSSYTSTQEVLDGLQLSGWQKAAVTL